MTADVFAFYTAPDRAAFNQKATARGSYLAGLVPSALYAESIVSREQPARSA